MNNIEKELLKEISKHITNKVPQIYILDKNSGRVFQYGKNCHDRLVISEDGRCLYYENMQDGDGSKVGDYQFYYEKPKIETEEEIRNAYYIDKGARTIEHFSNSPLLELERKKVCEQIYQLFTNESMWKTMKDWWLNNGECRELKAVLSAVGQGLSNQEIIENFSKDREYYCLLNKLKEENNG